MRVLVLGADGAVGSYIAKRLATLGHDVVETTRRKGSEGSRRVLADLAAPDFDASRLPQADLVLVCAAMARFADGRERPDLAWRVNVEVPAAVARHAAQTDTRVLLLSTSAVFDCLSPHASAERRPDGLSAYGRMKAEAEAAVLAHASTGSVLRLTKVLTPQMSLLSGWIDEIAAGRPVRAFSDMTISPITLDDVEAALLTLMKTSVGTILQVSAADDLSYASIARHLAERLGRDPALVVENSAAAAGIPATEITRFTSLDTTALTLQSSWSPGQGLDAVDRVFFPTPAAFVRA